MGENKIVYKLSNFFDFQTNKNWNPTNIPTNGIFAEIFNNFSRTTSGYLHHFFNFRLIKLIY